MRVNLEGMRNKRGWSQAELSRRSEVPQPMISEIERGVVSNPTVITLFKLSTALRCSLDDLIVNDEIVGRRKSE